ncbi:MAG: hypothetical protein HY692_09985 [Cyanobacteria bacterium NC_groundwater_1444_Ag_S-0.65um_54_12]|nr:hypothetical protein [Cyanobacteria bacterium NC_groundwater_1444_Ag_S-0.65um_54_12]
MKIRLASGGRSRAQDRLIAWLRFLIFDSVSHDRTEQNTFAILPCTVVRTQRPRYLRR